MEIIRGLRAACHLSLQDQPTNLAGNQREAANKTSACCLIHGGFLLVLFDSTIE
jgi:hypothetical protein